MTWFENRAKEVRKESSDEQLDCMGKPYANMPWVKEKMIK